MPLIKEIEDVLPLMAELPEEWQKDLALVISKTMLAHDRTLTMTPAEQKADRDRDIANTLRSVKQDRPVDE
jgi:hypothetical protein